MFNDGAMIALSKDRVVASPTPNSWNLRAIFISGIVYGLYLTLSSWALFFAASKTEVSLLSSSSPHCSPACSWDSLSGALQSSQSPSLLPCSDLLRADCLHCIVPAYASFPASLVSPGLLTLSFCCAVLQRQMPHVQFEHKDQACHYLLQPDDS